MSQGTGEFVLKMVEGGSYTHGILLGRFKSSQSDWMDEVGCRVIYLYCNVIHPY